MWSGRSVLGLAVLSVVLVVVAVACRPTSTLPVLFPGPDFALTDQEGRPFGSTDLHGRVVLANFMFTSCTDVCPLLTGTMALVRDELRAAGLLGARAVLVSISVDPTVDTPDALTIYGGRFGAVPREWRFLTGDQQTIDGLLIGGFKVGRPTLRSRVPGGAPEIVHSTRVVLLDPSWNVRAMFNGDMLDVSAVVDEVRRLAA